MDTQKLLDEQVAYYEARAPEYDNWFLRLGKYDLGPEVNKQWVQEANEVEDALAKHAPLGDVLEIACGTGWWTGRLEPYCTSLTAVDSSDEVLKINQAKYQSPKIEYQQADIFKFKPEKKYDFIFFSFWLSHVPPEKFEAFFELLAASLNEGGKIFLMDSRAKSKSDAGLLVHSDGKYQTRSNDDVVMQRTLKDGRDFNIVKIYYSPEVLNQNLASLGWKANIQETERFFVFGSAEVI